ncbi:MAG: hypothetical protein DRI39_06005 [Chloroflexi bacterium]|mgnify:CR=1 FL=1|nr:MAG: hypothetical protein DRI39_06005 [Chloroflexota bacterium]
MALIEELRRKREVLLGQMAAIDREAATVREEFECRLAGLRKSRQPLEEKVRLIDALIKAEEEGQ